jgi:hypothetical protein
MRVLGQQTKAVRHQSHIPGKSQQAVQCPPHGSSDTKVAMALKDHLARARREPHVFLYIVGPSWDLRINPHGSGE